MSELVNIIVTNLLNTITLTTLVLGLMTIIDLLELRYEGKIRSLITERPATQYIVASLLGAIPGCIDAFLIDTLYIYGLVSFGSVVTVMLSTAGDEAFIMLAMIPKAVPIIFAVDVVVGMIGGFLSDKVADKINLSRAPPHRPEFHETKLTIKHFLRDHFHKDIIRKNAPRLFLWLFATMTVFEVSNLYLDWVEIVQSIPQARLLLPVIAALVGLIPVSGPHYAFVVLYRMPGPWAGHGIPLSALLVSTMSQDGHGLIPLLSYSLKDTLNVQVATTIISFTFALILYLIGV